MKKLVLTTILLLSLGALQSLAATAGNTTALWQKGISYYDGKQYDSAAYYLEQIAALKPQNEAVYYNLGNTYYKLNKIAPAVLNYERALRINPEYKEARENLVLAQSRISNHIPYLPDVFFITWWQNITKAKNASAWAISALTVFILIIVVVGLRRMRKGGTGLPSQTAGVLTFVFFCLLIMAIVSARNSDKNVGAVVMQNDAPLMNSDLKGKPLILVPEGTTVKMVSEKPGWVEVTLPDGRNGWLQQSLLEKI